MPEEYESENMRIMREGREMERISEIGQVRDRLNDLYRFIYDYQKTIRTLSEEVEGLREQLRNMGEVE